MQQREVYTMKQVQQMLGISKTKTYQLAKDRVFPVIMLGRNYLSPVRAFDRWLDGCGQVIDQELW